MSLERLTDKPKGLDLMTVLDFPLDSTDALDSLDALIGPAAHVIDAGHCESAPAAARIPLQVAVELPANYLVAALLLSAYTEEDLTTVADVRQAVAVALLSVSFAELETRAYAMLPTQLDIDSAAWAEVLRVKVAQAFAPCDPWALPQLAGLNSAPTPIAMIPYACDPS